MAAQELVGASGTIDSSHAVAQGALGVETLGQALILVAFCRTLMVLLFKIRSSLLAWQQNLVRW